MTAPTATSAVPVPTASTTSARPSGADFRLLLPAVSAWVVTAALLRLEPGSEAPVLAVAGTAALAAVLLLRRPGALRRRRAAATLAAVLLTGAAAAIATPLHTADLHRGPLPELARAAEHAEPQSPTAAVEVELTITGDPKTHTSRGGTSGGQPFLTVDAVADRVVLLQDGRTTRTHTPVTVMARGAESASWQRLLPSERLAAEADVRPAEEGHDTESAALLVVHGPPRQLAPPSLPQRIAGRLREGLRTAADGLPADARGLLPGLVVGDTSRLPDDLEDAFRATDLVHLVAVSGANLAIVLGALLGAPGQAGTAERRGLAAVLGLSLRTGALLGTGLTLAFVTVCRPEPSVLRAAGTGLVGMLALATGRPRQAVPALAGAVLVLVLLDPFLAHSFGFLLSVLATAGLLVLGPHWAEALRARRWPHHLAGALAATAAAQALCAPVTVVLSGHISLVGIPCNLLAELAVAPATLLGFGVLALQPLLPGVARLLAEPAGVPAGWLALVARRGAELPGGQLTWPGGWFGTATVALAVLAACWAAPLLLPRPVEPGRPAPSRRWVRVLVTGALLAALLAVLLRPPPLARIATGWPPPGWRLAMCDVGQGDMLALAAGEPDSAVVIDTGPDPNAADRCLRDLGITTVPLLLLTHFHADHVEGVPGVLRGRRVGAVEGTTLDDPPGEAARVTRWAAEAGVPLLRARRGERRSAGAELAWDVVWPVPGSSAEAPGANNASVALLVSLTGGLRMALLGDLEPPAQSALSGRLGRVDVLKVAHHGSAHQDWGLTSALRPRLALISCGEGNPYGHPSPKTVDHLRGLGATVLRTDRVGDIAVTGDSPATLGVSVHPQPAHAGQKPRTHGAKERAASARPGENPGTPRAPPV
ncbi:ComEC/Rec2 family competence protein [Streptomyces sp. NRRL S-350]|uniref:ComEC/Rec2 family competence protein n=1 Tax=Streptomyces sp. NRRL S-350 TaxID=1463902 RepID=UPI0007C5235A|nr:ComEC/Rec2 family competence protein [Streptomyces sp. NRRL S-350]